MQSNPQGPDLVLLVCLLASLVAFVVAAIRAIRGRRAGARSLLTRWALGVLIYIGISLGASFIRPAQTIPVGTDWCFDDWCLAITRVTRTAVGGDSLLALDVRVSNKARFPEAVRNFWAYVRDEADHRYAPRTGTWSTVVATQVPAYSSVDTSMVFAVTASGGELGFVTGHGSGTPCALVPSVLVIGQGGCLFHRPDMIRIR